LDSHLCRSGTYAESDIDALVYAIPTAAGQRQQLASVPASQIFWQAVNESATEHVIGAGRGGSSWVYEPFLDSFGFRVWRTVTTSTTMSNCRVEFRQLAGGSTNRSIPTNDPCSFDGLEGSGTVSPQRVRPGAPVSLLRGRP
jgi:hypothetical protein